MQGRNQGFSVNAQGVTCTPAVQSKRGIPGRRRLLAGLGPTATCPTACVPHSQHLQQLQAAQPCLVTAAGTRRTSWHKQDSNTVKHDTRCSKQASQCKLHQSHCNECTHMYTSVAAGATHSQVVLGNVIWGRYSTTQRCCCLNTSPPVTAGHCQRATFFFIPQLNTQPQMRIPPVCLMKSQPTHPLTQTDSRVHQARPQTTPNKRHLSWWRNRPTPSQQSRRPARCSQLSQQPQAAARRSSTTCPNKPHILSVFCLQGHGATSQCTSHILSKPNTPNYQKNMMHHAYTPAR